MSRNYHINGTDFLMLGFDHELRRNGFAGNTCQIILELDSAIDAAALRERVRSLVERYPILAARCVGWFRPAWKPVQIGPDRIPVREHQDRPGLTQKLCNEPLQVERGEQVRFDVLHRSGGNSAIVFTWAHALMDAPGAEYLLALTGRGDLTLPLEPTFGISTPSMSLFDRFRAARKNLFQIDDFCKSVPRSLGTLRGGGAGHLVYRVETFSAPETERVLRNAARFCGVLGVARYHAAVSLAELHRLHHRLNLPTPSYILPIPVGLRPKGSIEPIFRNQVTMLMTQALTEHLETITDSVARLKSQIEAGTRNGLIESGQLLANLFRFLPLPVLMAILKRGLHGEICSLFYGDTGAVSQELTHFMGARIENLIHVAAVTPSPGLGVIFYEFRGLLRMTVLNLSNVLAEAEAAEFARDLRARLLDP